MKRFLLIATLTIPVLCVAQKQEVLERENDSTVVKTLKEISVTAMRSSTEAPVVVSTITEKEIKSISTAEDIPFQLQNLPSIIATSDAGNGVGYTDIRMRGYDGTRINVTMGDVPLNEAESHKVYWVDTPNLIESASSVEIGRGATGSSNGSGAFGGTINLEPQKFADKVGGGVDVMYGSYNTNKELVRVTSGLLKERWAVEGLLSHTSSDGYVERASSNMGSYMLQAGYLGVNTTVKFLSFGGIEHTYNAWDGITKEQMAADRRYNPCGEMRDDNGNVVGFYLNQKDNFIQTNNHLSLKHLFNGFWSLNATAHYTYGNGWYDQYKNDRKLKEYGLTGLHDASGATLKRSNLTRQKSQSSNYGGAIAYAVYRNRSVTTDFGLSWTSYGSDHWGSVTGVVKASDFTGSSEYYRNYCGKNEGTAFAKVLWEAFRGFNLYADIQYRFVDYNINGTNDTYNYTTGAMDQLNIYQLYNFVNPKVGLSYNFCGYHKVYASGAIANREPTRRDFTNAIDGNMPKPERLYDVEFGYSATSKWITGTLNFYYMIYKDQLCLTGAQNPDTYEALYTNIADSYRRGIELDVTVTPLKWLWFGGNVTLSQNRALNYTEYVYNEDTYCMDAFYLGTTDLSYSPSVTALIKAGVDTHGFTAGWYTHYVGKQYITNGSNENLTIDPYWVTNLKLGYAFNVKSVCRISLGVSLNNLLNAEYCSNAFAYSSISGGVRTDTGYYFAQAKFNATGSVKIEF